MTVAIVTTEATRVLSTKKFVVTNLTNYNNSSNLRVNSKSPFTIHFAIWPFVGLLSLIVIVWFLVYMSTIFSRHHRPKHEHQNFASLYVTPESTIAGGYDVSNAVSPVDV